MAFAIPNPDDWSNFVNNAPRDAVEELMRAIRGMDPTRAPVPNPETPNPEEDYRLPPQHRAPPGLAPHGPIPNSQLRRQSRLGSDTTSENGRDLLELAGQGPEFQPELGPGSMNAESGFTDRFYRNVMPSRLEGRRTYSNDLGRHGNNPYEMPNGEPVDNWANGEDASGEVFPGQPPAGGESSILDEITRNGMQTSAGWIRRNAPFDPLGAIVGAKNGTIAQGSPRALIQDNGDGTYSLLDGAHRVGNAHPGDDIPSDFIDENGNPIPDPTGGPPTYGANAQGDIAGGMLSRSIDDRLGQMRSMQAVSRDEGQYPPERTPIEYDIQDRVRQETEDAINQGLGHDPSLLDLTQHEDPSTMTINGLVPGASAAYQPFAQPVSSGGGGAPADDPNLFHRIFRWQGTPADQIVRAVTPLPSNQTAATGAAAGTGEGLMQLLYALAAAA